jgi:hypothetical protein
VDGLTGSGWRGPEITSQKWSRVWINQTKPDPKHMVMITNPVIPGASFKKPVMYLLMGYGYDAFRAMYILTCQVN